VCKHLYRRQSEAAYFLNGDTNVGKIKVYKIVNGDGKRGKIAGQ